MAHKKCPKCGSSNTSTTVLGGIEAFGEGLAAGIAGLAVGIFNNSHAAHTAHAVYEHAPRQHKCNICGHTWHE